MIISSTLSNKLLVRVVNVVCEKYSGSIWHIVNPQFIASSTEDEHIEREVVLGGNEWMYSLSGEEVATMLGERRLGFDWTYVAVVTDLAQGKGTCFLYIQCIDSGPTHVWTDDESITNKLFHEGFVLSNLESLPFPMREIEKLKLG